MKTSQTKPNQTQTKRIRVRRRRQIALTLRQTIFSPMADNSILFHLICRIFKNRINFALNAKHFTQSPLKIRYILLKKHLYIFRNCVYKHIKCCVICIILYILPILFTQVTLCQLCAHFIWVSLLFLLSRRICNISNPH